MIGNDQELSATLERIRHLQTQVTHLRTAKSIHKLPSVGIRVPCRDRPDATRGVRVPLPSPR